MDSKSVLIAGAGIGGLALSVALAQKHIPSTVLEKRNDVQEVGAGIQLGANVTKILGTWGNVLPDLIKTFAYRPPSLVVRNGYSGDVLAEHELGRAHIQRFGFPYLTVARADLYTLLRMHAHASGFLHLHLGESVTDVSQNEFSTIIETDQNTVYESPVLIGADGLWSHVRQCIWQDGLPTFTGHVAYRALVPMNALPRHIRKFEVNIWLGKTFHIVHYPVKAGEYLNVVVLMEASAPVNLRTWSADPQTVDLPSFLPGMCSLLLDLLSAISAWRMWPLCGRYPIKSSAELACGRIALLGDAAHPMLPYLAQGAGMAIEDAFVCAEALNHVGSIDSPLMSKALFSYANHRWKRCARIQKQSTENGKIFHATGLKQMARDTLLKLLGSHLIEQPWLYGYRLGGSPTNDA